MSRREAFVSEAMRLAEVRIAPDGGEQRTWYVWGGRFPETGLDCSGLVAHCLWAVGGPDWRKTHWSGRMWRELPPAIHPLPGDLAMYGPPGSVNHVMAVVGPSRIAGEFVVVGASGGNSDTTTIEIARLRRAFVKRKPTHLYRPGFRGFRRLVPLDT